MAERNSPAIKIRKSIYLSSLLLFWMLWLAPPTVAQTTGNFDDDEEEEFVELERPSRSNEGGRQEVRYESQSRPFNAYERFSYESAMANQLQSLVSRYLNSGVFHIGVQIEGRMMSTGAAPKIAEVKGRGQDKTEEDKLLEMLPALPFFSARLRAPVTVEAVDKVNDAGPAPGAGNTALGNGPAIDRIKVFFVVDTSVTGDASAFYRGLITQALRLDPARGDEIVVSTAAFPVLEEGQSVNAPIVNVQARMEPAPFVDTGINEVIASMGKELSILIGAGLVLLGIFVFVGLVWRGKRKAEMSMSGNGSLSGGRADFSGAGMGMGMGAGGNGAGMGPITISAEAAAGNDAQLAELTQTDPVTHWIINERENLVFVIEKLVREQGLKGVQKVVTILYPHGQSMLDMVSGQLEPRTLTQVRNLWEEWNADAADAVAMKRALDDVALAMRNQKQFGHYPFIIHLKDKEIVALLEEEDPLQCLMVLDALNPARKMQIMNLMGAERTSQILSCYPELAEQRFEQYAALGTVLFGRVKKLKESGKHNEAAYDQVLATIEMQSMAQQEQMLENLKGSNKEMYDYIRERILLWPDVVDLSNDLLRDAVEGLDSESIAALLNGDEEVQKRVLSLRPPREQVLIRDMLKQNSITAERTEEERRKFLMRVRRFKATVNNEQAEQTA